jgi:hypothetical protein
LFGQEKYYKNSSLGFLSSIGYFLCPVQHFKNMVFLLKNLKREKKDRKEK